MSILCDRFSTQNTKDTNDTKDNKNNKYINFNELSSSKSFNRFFADLHNKSRFLQEFFPDICYSIKLNKIKGKMYNFE